MDYVIKYEDLSENSFSEVKKFICIIKDEIVKIIGKNEYDKLKKGPINENEYPLLDPINKIYLINYETNYIQRNIIIVYNQIIDEFFSYYTSTSGGNIFHLLIPFDNENEDKTDYQIWFFKPNYDYVTGLTIDFNIVTNFCKLKDFDKYRKFKLDDTYKNTLIYYTQINRIPQKYFNTCINLVSNYFKTRMIKLTDIFNNDLLDSFKFGNVDSILCDDTEITKDPYKQRYDKIISASLKKNIKISSDDNYKKKRINQLKLKCIIDKLSNLIETNFTVVNQKKLFDYSEDLKNFLDVKYNCIVKFDLENKSKDPSINDDFKKISMFFLYYNTKHRSPIFEEINKSNKNYTLCLFITPYNSKVNEFGLNNKYFFSGNLTWKILDYKQHTPNIIPCLRNNSRDVCYQYNFIGDIFSDVFPTKYFDENGFEKMYKIVRNDAKGVSELNLLSGDYNYFDTYDFQKDISSNEKVSDNSLSSSNVNEVKFKYLKYKAKYMELKKLLGKNQI